MKSLRLVKFLYYASSMFYYFLWFFVIIISLSFTYSFFDKEFSPFEIYYPIETRFEDKGESIISEKSELEFEIESAEYELRFKKPSGEMLRASIVFIILAVLILQFIIYNFKGIMKNLTLKKPFLKENYRKTRFIGLALLLLSVFTSISELIISLYLSDQISIVSSTITSSIVSEINTIIAGLVVLVFSEVLKVGYEIKKEQDLTV